MIKKYKIFKESLLNKLEGPSEDEVINNLSKNPNKLLLFSCEEGLLEYVKKSLENGADIHYKKDSAVKIVAQDGNLEILKYLISKGANFRVDSDTPMEYAAFGGHLDIIKYLVEMGVKIYFNSSKALDAAIRNGHLDVVKYLVEKGINVRIHKQFLDIASRHGHLDIVKYLIGKGADFYNQNAMYVAKINKFYKIVYFLEQEIKTHIREDFINGRFGKYTMSLSDFRKYCSDNNIEYLSDEEILLYKINYTNKHGDMELNSDDVLKIALRKDYKKIIDYYLNHPKELEKVEQLYYYFVSNGDLETVKKLVEEGKIKIKNNKYIIDLRLLLYNYLVKRDIDMFLYMFGFYKNYTRWEIEWLYDMVNDKHYMNFKNNSEKIEIYKPVIDLLKKKLDEFK